MYSSVERRIKHHDRRQAGPFGDRRASTPDLPGATGSGLLLNGRFPVPPLLRVLRRVLGWSLLSGGCCSRIAPPTVGKAEYIGASATLSMRCLRQCVVSITHI